MSRSIKFIVLIFIITYSVAFAQSYRVKTIHWKVVDREVSERILNTYLEKLTREQRRENQCP